MEDHRKKNAIIDDEDDYRDCTECKHCVFLGGSRRKYYCNKHSITVLKDDEETLGYMICRGEDFSLN